jgi:hypothetical protein
MTGIVDEKIVRLRSGKFYQRSFQKGAPASCGTLEARALPFVD